MKLLFLIETLRSGGKERRLVELIKIISTMPDFVCKIVVIDDIIHFKKHLLPNVDIIILKRKYFKKDLSIFFKFYRICSKFSPDIIHVWGNMPAF